MSASRKAYLQIHFCVLLWGFTAILGKLITLSALPLVWWRMLMVTLILICVPKVWRDLAGMSKARLWALAGVGALVSLHWLTFYAAIKLANASVAATCIALAPVFLALAEPLFQRKPIDPRDLLIGVMVVPGVMLVVGGIPAQMLTGVLVGIISAALVAAFSLLNKQLVEHESPMAITALELASGTVCLTVLGAIWLLIEPETAEHWLSLPGTFDFAGLFVLALLCTLLPFVLSLVALRQLSAFSAQLAVNLEPIYAIVLAALIFSEHSQLGWRFYLGAGIVIAGVFVHPLLQRSARPAEASSLAVAEAKSLDP